MEIRHERRGRKVYSSFYPTCLDNYLYVNEGENIMTTYAVSNKKNKDVSLSSNRNMKINLKLNELKSSWE